MTDTIGWGDVDERSRRLPRWRLSRRRQIALVVVAALVAGGIVGWPEFRSWRADEAARHMQRIWARMQGLDDTRIQSLAAVQRTLGILDAPEFAPAVVVVEREEATDLDGLARQARALRTWTSDVGKARAALVAAIVAQAKALRQQAGRPGAIGIDLPLTTAIDQKSSDAIDAAGNAVEAMRTHRHLKYISATTEHFRATASAAFATLLRPTDQPLHLRLVTS
ncbi:MAG: hypothetical protein JO074_02090, partial [Frankiales bacterium]|nr:hypothetical protein [Frankiales bacterium]